MAIADLCLHRNWDVRDFVRQSFSYIRKTHYYITPWDIMNVARRYKGWSHKEEWEGLQEQVIDYELAGYSEADILMNPFAEFPAWFRCLYPEEPSEELLATWGDLARQELKEPGLKEFAMKVAPEAYNRVLGGQL